MPEATRKTLQDIFGEDPVLQNFARELEDKMRPRRRAIARDRGFLVRNRSEIRCQWHENCVLVPVVNEKGAKESSFFICELCLQEKNQPRDEELVNFAAASATYAYWCVYCRGFVRGHPLAGSRKGQPYICAVCSLNVSSNRL